MEHVERLALGQVSVDDAVEESVVEREDHIVGYS